MRKRKSHREGRYSAVGEMPSRDPITSDKPTRRTWVPWHLFVDPITGRTPRTFWDWLTTDAGVIGLLLLTALLFLWALGAF